MINPGWLLFIPLTILSIIGTPFLSSMKRIVLPWPATLVAVVFVFAASVYLVTHSTIAAWIWLSAFALLIQWFEAAIAHDLRFPLRLVLSPVFAGMFSFLTVSFWVWESRFSEEEFFVVVMTVLLAVLWWFLWVFVFFLSIFIRLPHWRVRYGIPVRRSVPISLLCCLLVIDILWVVNQYQASFYPRLINTPFPGISEQTPFLCSQAPPEKTVYQGIETWRRYIKLVENNPKKGPPEYGILALSLNSEPWAKQFHVSLLKEAEESEFSGPVNSIKIGQYHAALRAYYYPKVRDAFPNLFTYAEEKQIQEWFGLINQRALTVEWVDWMYALAFTKPPEGPYENQENGAGLLAILKSNGLEHPALVKANSNYLMQNQRGWFLRFHNTDDAIMYQPIWINNAFFQYIQSGRVDEEKMQQAFAWLLNQALPNGDDLQYNHPEATSFVGTAYLGAKLLQDGRYLWLAGRGIETLEKRSGFLQAQPGIEQPVTFDSIPPETGSCLIYSDSGLPNQVGPLAPDKVVIRNGWGSDAVYMLVNLRFSGWHRYKATNTITLFHHQEPSVLEANSAIKSEWLPAGRSAFRDKRIPRENLNGLSIERTGISLVLHALTGIGSRWEQDPPFYSEVSEFHTGEEINQAQVNMVNWHGWTQNRQIIWTNDGLIVVIDRVQGPTKAKGSIFWHLRGEVETDQRVRLGSSSSTDELLFMALGDKQLSFQKDTIESQGPNLLAEYQVPEKGEGRLISIFLTGSWSGSVAEVENQDGSSVLRVRSAIRDIEISLQDKTEVGIQ